MTAKKITLTQTFVVPPLTQTRLQVCGDTLAGGGLLAPSRAGDVT
jgi:hypothetical protein